MTSRLKPRRTPKQIAALVKLNARPRGRNGAPLGNDALKVFRAEELQRIVDRMYMSPAQLHKLNRNTLRAQEVMHEKKSRYARMRATPKLYNADSRDALEDTADIDNGIVPKPTETIRHGIETERVWTWRGPHAFETAQSFLRLAQSKLPADSKGFLAMGNGRGKNATWIGTHFGSPEQVLKHSHTFLTSQSANTVALNSLPHAERDSSIWAEVKMTTQGRVSHERKAAGSKPVARGNKRGKKRASAQGSGKKSRR